MTRRRREELIQRDVLRVRAVVDWYVYNRPVSDWPRVDWPMYRYTGAPRIEGVPRPVHPAGFNAFSLTVWKVAAMLLQERAAEYN